MYYLLAILLAGASCCSAAGVPSQRLFESSQVANGGFDLSKVPPMNTHIALLTPDGFKDKVEGDKHVVLDTSKLLKEATVLSGPSEPKGDIEEDPKDRFITTRSGKRRPVLLDGPEADDWADERPVAIGALHRVKRCGGGDDDDANRARRARRRRANRARRARRAQRRAAKRRESTSTTTVTRKVIQNGQVISQTSETGPVPQVASSASSAPVLVHPAPVVVAAPAAPQQLVQQPQPVAAPQVAAPSVALPSVAVQGSVKIN